MDAPAIVMWVRWLATQKTLLALARPRFATVAAMAVITTNDTDSKLSAAQRRFVELQRVARFASADAHGQPHVVPVCYCVIGEAVYFSIDEKPKQADVHRLKRLRNIAQNPKVALVIDHYDENWSQLGWVMLRGQAELLDDGDEHALAQQTLRARYPQYRSMQLSTLPVVATRIRHVASWGALDR
jgi:PPOX class probable F420-dependent enzyme